MKCGKKSKIKKSKTLIIRDGVFGCGVSVVFTRKFDNPGALAYTYKSDDPSYCPAICFNLEDELTVNTIIHEILHAIRYELGIRKTVSYLEKWDDEVLPYMTSYCFEEIVKFCMKNDIKVSLI